MSNTATIRYLATSVRSAVSQNASNFGEEFGWKLANRIIGEMGGYIADAHSPVDAIEALYRAGDRVQATLPLGNVRGDLSGMPRAVGVDEEMTPGMKASAERYDAALVIDSVDGVPEKITLNGASIPEAIKALRKAANDLEGDQRRAWPRWRKVLHAIKPSEYLVGFFIGLGLGVWSR